MNLFEKVFDKVLSEDMSAGDGGVFGGGDSFGHGGAVPGGSDFHASGDARNIFGGYSMPKKKKRKPKKKYKQRSKKKKTKKKKMHEIGPPSQPVAFTRRFPELLSGMTHNKSAIGRA